MSHEGHKVSDCPDCIEEQQGVDPGCPSCAALKHNCGGHWNAGRRRSPGVRETRGRTTLDVIDEDFDHDAFNDAADD